MKAEAKKITLPGAILTVIEHDPFDPKKRIETHEPVFETASEIRKKYKSETVLKKGQRSQTNSQRYQRDNLRRISKKEVGAEKAYDFRTHRTEEPHKMFRRRQSIRFMDVEFEKNWDLVLEVIWEDSKALM